MGAAAEMKSALRRSIESATAPRNTAATPPRPIEKPIERPEASADVAGQVLLRHHHRDPERSRPRPCRPRRGRSPPAMPPTSRNTSISGHADDEAAHQHGPQPDAIGERPGQQRADRADQEHPGEDAVPVRLRVAERHLLEGHERDQTEPGEAAERDHGQQHRERAQVVLARARHPAPRRRGRSRAGSAWPRAAAPRRAGTGTTRSQRAAQPERDDDRRDHQRAEPVAEVAADREQRHPARPLAPARCRRRTSSPPDGTPPSRARRRSPARPRASTPGRRAASRHPDAADRHARRQQPDRAAGIRPEAEERLDDRRPRAPTRAPAPRPTCTRGRTRRGGTGSTRAAPRPRNPRPRDRSRAASSPAGRSARARRQRIRIASRRAWRSPSRRSAAEADTHRLRRARPGRVDVRRPSTRGSGCSPSRAR